MTDICNLAVADVQRSLAAFCRFITANDVNLTSHQAGFYVPKEAASVLFSHPGTKGCNKDKKVKIRWQGDFVTDSRFIYYGAGTRNEYRITRFGRGFQFLAPDYVGSMLVICMMEDDYYTAYVLEHDDDIEEFLLTFNLAAGKTGYLVKGRGGESPDGKLNHLIMETAARENDFPATDAMSHLARLLCDKAYGIGEREIISNPDGVLMRWYDTESRLFYKLEEKIYKPIYSAPFKDCQALIDFSNKILNRRKSRAGKSLEHHLSAIFSAHRLRFDEQAVTEGNKQPDFLFPGSEEYHNLTFPAEDLTFLGAKTTCKDRWRQILNEANRIKDKHLFTLQPGVSVNQLKEMKVENVTLVVPRANRGCFDPSFRTGILSLEEFVGLVQERQGRYQGETA